MTTDRGKNAQVPNGRIGGLLVKNYRALWMGLPLLGLLAFPSLRIYVEIGTAITLMNVLVVVGMLVRYGVRD